MTYNGAPAAGADLALRHWDGVDWSSAGTTTVESDGSYLFTGVPSLGSGEMYYVRYGPNATDDRYVLNWYGPDILSYTAGQRIHGGDFELANVSLLSPPSGFTATLPQTFTWQRRGHPGDTYRWEMFELVDPYATWRTGDLGDVDSYQLSGLPQNAVYDLEYGWDVLVFSAPDSFGECFYYRTVTFAESAVSAAEVLLQERAMERERHKQPGDAPLDP